MLNLQMSKVDDENAPALARELAALTSPGLEELDIGWNDLSDVGATLVAEALLPHASTLRSVRLAHNHIGDSGAMALASALVTHMKLMTLDLSANSVSAKGVAVVRALTAALPHFSSVRLDAEGDPAPPELAAGAAPEEAASPQAEAPVRSFRRSVESCPKSYEICGGDLLLAAGRLGISGAFA